MKNELPVVKFELQTSASIEVKCQRKSVPSLFKFFDRFQQSDLKNYAAKQHVKKV